MVKRLLLLCFCAAGCSHSIAPTVPPPTPKPSPHAVYDTIPFGDVPIFRTKDATISVTLMDSGLTITSVVLTDGAWSLVDSLPHSSPRTLKLHFLFTPIRAGDTSATLLVLSNNDTVLAARLLGSGGSFIAHKVGDSYTFNVTSGTATTIEVEKLVRIAIDSTHDTTLYFSPGIPYWQNQGSYLRLQQDGDIACMFGVLPILTHKYYGNGADTGQNQSYGSSSFDRDTVVSINGHEFTSSIARIDGTYKVYDHGWSGFEDSFRGAFSRETGYYTNAKFHYISYNPGSSADIVDTAYTLVSFKLVP